MMYFFPVKNTTITGIEHTQAQAESSPHIVISLKELLKTAKPTVNVRIESVFVAIKGHKKLFQVVIKVKTASVATAGIA